MLRFHVVRPTTRACESVLVDRRLQRAKACWLLDFIPIDSFCVYDAFEAGGQEDTERRVTDGYFQKTLRNRISMLFEKLRNP
jgi:hypothetical protein